VHYRFHPSSGQELRVLRSRHRDEAVTVRDPAGMALVIPTWMLVPEAALIQVEGLSRDHASHEERPSAKGTGQFKAKEIATTLRLPTVGVNTILPLLGQ